MYEYYGNNDYRDYLIHHGILGMKWGVRRYQNKDGSYTPAGKKRYGIGEQKALYKSAKKVSNRGYYKDITNFDKKLKKSIDDDQKKNLSRLNKEWNKIAADSLEADDKLYNYVTDDYSLEQARKDHPNLARKVDEGNKIWEEYHNELEKTVDSILGEYGKEVISKNKYTGYTKTGKEYVEHALHQMVYSDWYSTKFDSTLKRKH